VANKSLQIIGIKDRLDLPTADIKNIPCKIDTGAYNCSIHCVQIRKKKDKEGPYIEFILLDEEFEEYNGKVLTCREFRQKKVKSSNGKAQNRYQVVLPVVLFNQTFNATFNLSKRHNMRFPILLGRKFLNKKFMVDVSKKDLSFNLKCQ
jgi:hypothetical protein